jgi:flagellar biosynthetic protein FliR
MTLSEVEIGALAATFLRAAGLAVTAPVVGDSDVPMRARLVFVIAITLAIGPNRAGVPYADLAAVGLLEISVGLMTGLVSRFILSRAAIAGQLIGLSLGLGFAAQYDPRANESASTLRSLAAAIAGLAFLACGGLEEIVRSVAAAPAQPHHLLALGPEILRSGVNAFGHGLALAAPIVLAALVGNVGLALMNRAAPAANVFSIALAAILIIGGLVLLATASGFVTNIAGIAREAVTALGGG